MQKTIKISFPKYLNETGVLGNWDTTSEVQTEINEGGTSFIISSNKEGLLSLASYLVSLAQDDVPEGSHFHFDDFGFFQVGSKELIIQKKSK